MNRSGHETSDDAVSCVRAASRPSRLTVPASAPDRPCSPSTGATPEPGPRLERDRGDRHRPGSLTIERERVDGDRPGRHVRLRRGDRRRLRTVRDHPGRAQGCLGGRRGRDGRPRRPGGPRSRPGGERRRSVRGLHRHPAAVQGHAERDRGRHPGRRRHRGAALGRRVRQRRSLRAAAGGTGRLRAGRTDRAGGREADAGHPVRDDLARTVPSRRPRSTIEPRVRGGLQRDEGPRARGQRDPDAGADRDRALLVGQRVHPVEPDDAGAGGAQEARTCWTPRG